MKNTSILAVASLLMALGVAACGDDTTDTGTTGGSSNTEAGATGGGGTGGSNTGGSNTGGSNTGGSDTDGGDTDAGGTGGTVDAGGDAPVLDACMECGKDNCIAEGGMTCYSDPACLEQLQIYIACLETPGADGDDCAATFQTSMPNDDAGVFDAVTALTTCMKESNCYTVCQQVAGDGGTTEGGTTEGGNEGGATEGGSTDEGGAADAATE